MLNSQLLDFGVPWSADQSHLLEAIHEALPHDRLVAAVTRGPRIEPDGILLTSGHHPASLVRDLAPFAQDELVRQALRGGAATSEGADGHRLLALLPEQGEAGVRWTLALTRSGNAFSETEARIAELILRRWQCDFLQPREPRLSQLLLGHDDRLLAADLDTQARRLREPEAFGAFIANFQTIVAQRFPDLAADDAAGQDGDLALRLAGQPLWIHFRRRQIEANPGSGQWHLELRPLHFVELADVGQIGDERVAKAVGYLDRHYRRGPNLPEIARAAHMSPFHFHRRFRREAGLSPKQYLLLKQLEIAAWLLRTRRLPVSVVADEAGFSSHGHFTTTFRRFFAQSPTEYRDQT